MITDVHTKMNSIGKIVQISRDLETKSILVTLALFDASIQDLQALKALDKLAVCIKKWKKKRSLDANAYAWVLMSKIANAINSSKEEVYEELLQNYGPIYEDEDGYVAITVKSMVDMSKIGGHWKRYKDNGKFTSYLKIKGSSEYDTAEMSHFIDHIIEEAKELGIETLPPDEIERIKTAWHTK